MDVNVVAHTPGPWTWTYYKENIQILSGSEEQGWIWIVDVAHLVPDGETQANARLIAAAPDLLKCLKAAAQDFAIMRYGSRMEEWDAAIDKAEGR